MSSQEAEVLVQDRHALTEQEQRLQVLIEHGHQEWEELEWRPPRIGRPPKSDIERLQVWVWYWKLRSMCPPSWNDSRLDEEFGHHAGVSRLRIFDRIRRKGWFPHSAQDEQQATELEQAQGNKSKKTRKMLRSPSLVKDIDEDPRFRGTAALLDSKFWEMFGKKTGHLASVRKELNSFLNKKRLIRLEGNLNEVIDSQVEKAINKPEDRLKYISSAGIYTHWLQWELRQLDEPLERLTLVGLLLREALLLAHLDTVFVLKQVLNEQIHRLAKEPWLTPIRDEFVRLVPEYILRGHIDLRDEAILYDGESHRAVHGYIISKDSAFLDDGTGDPEEKDAWSKGLESTCNWVAAAVRGIDGQWDPTDAEYHDAAYQDWLRDRDDPNVQWPDCPDDGGSFVTNPEDWPPDLL